MGSGRILHYASRNDICLGSMLNEAMWGQDVFYIMHQGMMCLGSMLNDAV